MRPSQYVLYVTVTDIQPFRISFVFPYAPPGYRKTQLFKCGYAEQQPEYLANTLVVGATYRIISRKTETACWVWENISEVDPSKLDYELDTVFAAQKLRLYELKKWYDARPQGFDPILVDQRQGTTKTRPLLDSFATEDSQ
jgi:hypothetical protein